MIIKKIYLKAFGPFSNRNLDLTCPEPGLHIIYGPNEAGKSSSLRALKALLYGFPERTSDNFIYPNKELVVGGVLQNEKGDEITFFRRKRRKNDLLDKDGKPLAAHVLQPFLHGVDKKMFTALHGINHGDLVAGGREILDRKGEVGQAIFAAGSGIVSLKKVLDSLDTEADLLFKPKGHKQDINKAVSRYKTLRKEIRAATLPGRKWRELRDELAEDKEKLAKIERQRAALDKERRHLERLQQALPHLAVRRDLQKKIAGFGRVVLLPQDFSGARREIETKLHAARQQHEQAETRLAELRVQENDLTFSGDLLEQAELIEQLYQDLGSYNKALADRPRLDGMRISHRRRAGELLKQMVADLPLEQLEILRPLLGRRTGIQTLAAAHETLHQQLKNSTAGRDAIRRELGKTAKIIKPTPDGNADSLTMIVKSARKAGDIDKAAAEKKVALARLRQRCEKELQSLGLWEGDIIDLAALPLPLAATVNRFDRDFQDQENLAVTICREQEKILEKQADIVCEINKLRNAGEVLTEEDLNAARSKRDQGWNLLCRQWLQGDDITAQSLAYDELPLVQAYENNVEKADYLADRLRREADRVQKFAALQAEEQSCRDIMAGLTEKRRVQEKELDKIKKRWHELWQPCRIDPLPPREMTAWLNGIEKIKTWAAEIEYLTGELDYISRQRSLLRASLLGELSRTGISQEFRGNRLEPVISFCETVLDDIVKQKNRHEQAEIRRADLLVELESVQLQAEQTEKELEQWRQSWKETWSIADWAGNISPLEANDFLADLTSCFAGLKEADDLEKRIAGIDRDAGQLEKLTDSVVMAVAPELAGQDLRQKIIKLHSDLVRAREQQIIARENSKEIKKAVKKLKQAGAKLAALEAQMSDLRRQAGCSRDSELEEAEQRSSRFRALEEELDKTEKLLIRSAQGLDIDELAAQAREQDADELPGIISRLGREIDSFDVELRQLAEKVGEKKKELSRMDGGCRAADLAAESAEILARTNRLARRFVLLKTSSAVLRREIENFRRENQDPVVKIASRYFQQLTLGNFSALEVDEDEQGSPALGGVRAGKWIDVAAMSSGTRDQLYLSLRLASLEHQHESGALLPFIVDDILINFDDARSAATLLALADLAANIQVILFTHHQQILSAAAEIDRSDIVKIYDLEAG